jgi:hypothetical protein
MVDREEGTKMRGQVALLGLWLALVLVAPTDVGAQDATPTAASAPADLAAGFARTDRRYFLPFTADGLKPGLTVTGNERGVCRFTSSAALARPDAWDCIAETNEIYDPCFENPYAPRNGSEELACITSPFANEVVLLTPTDPLEREKEAAAVPGNGSNASIDLTDPWVLPWALELVNGDRCILLPGTADVFAGLPVHYGCSNGGAILGEPDRTQPVWAVSYVADEDIGTTLVDVAVAWS